MASFEMGAYVYRSSGTKLTAWLPCSACAIHGRLYIIIKPVEHHLMETCTAFLFNLIASKSRATFICDTRSELVRIQTKLTFIVLTNIIGKHIHFLECALVHTQSNTFNRHYHFGVVGLLYFSTDWSFCSRCRLVRDIMKTDKAEPQDNCEMLYATCRAGLLLVVTPLVFCGAIFIFVFTRIIVMYSARNG